ncbi:unnamed protein product [Boreogadus saida]
MLMLWLHRYMNVIRVTVHLLMQCGCIGCKSLFHMRSTLQLRFMNEPRRKGNIDPDDLRQHVPWAGAQPQRRCGLEKSSEVSGACRICSALVEMTRC